MHFVMRVVEKKIDRNLCQSDWERPFQVLRVYILDL